MSSPRSLNFARLFLLSLTFLCFCNAEASAQVQSLTSEVTPATRVTLGGELTVKITATAASGVPLPAIETVEWVGRDDFFSVKNTAPPAGVPQDGVYTFTLKAEKVTDARDITIKLGGKETKFNIAVVPQITKDTLEFEPSNLPSENLPVKQQKTEKVRLKLKGGAAIPRDALTATSDAKNIADVLVSDSTLIVTGNAPGTAKVTISAYGKEVQSFTVKVTEIVEEIRASDVLPFTKGDAAKPLVDLGIEIEGKEGTLWKGADAIAKLNFFSNRPDVVKLSSDETKLEIGDVGEAQLRISAKEDSSISRIVNVRVSPKATQIKLSPPSLVVVARQPAVTVQATVVDDAGRLVPGANVKFECEGANCTTFVNVVNKSDNSAEVRGLSKATAVKVVAKLVGNPSVASDPLLVDIVGADQITDFRPLLIKLDPEVDQIAKDLFGRKAADEFYVTKVNLKNNLKKTDTEYFGDSILVYSSSLQVRVALEVKCKKDDVNPRKGSTPITECTKEGEWVPVTVDMVIKYYNDKFKLDPPISGTEPIPEPEHSDPKMKPCRIQAPAGFVGLYRPYSFDTIASTHDRRDERSLRSRVLTTLNGAISFTSFVTAIAVPGPGSDLPLGLDKSNNLLIPSFEKLFPSMREVQRQNILNKVMRNLEEIPFGASLERYLFFPKGAVEGLWPGHRARISAVSTFDACAEVAIIKKVGQ